MKHEPIQDFFSRIAEQHADLIALEGEGVHISYRALDERANRLAHRLMDAGAGKGSLLVIYSDKTVEIVTAILGALKAGCTFVPLDTGLPEARLDTILADLDARWCFCDGSYLTDLAARLPEAHLICAGEVPDLDAADRARVLPSFQDHLDSSTPVVPTEPDEPCYIYFTSGSTGKPKGVVGRRKSLTHYIKWAIESFEVGPGTRLALLAKPSFDAYLTDLFSGICSGGTVCFPDSSDTVLDARKLIHWIDAQRVNIIHMVPSLFRTLITGSDGTPRFRELRFVLLAGEPVLPSDVLRWIDTYGEHTRLVNLYGATETTMTRFIYWIKPEDAKLRTIPIGQPIRGVRALVVDKNGKPCPPGSVGEIYIRTPYRSLGYFKLPEETARVFIPNPFVNNPEDIIYRSGDLGRVMEDGQFECLGRTDRQVKIRGIRIEPAEIESNLGLHPDVANCVVVAREDTPEEKVLVAYVEPRAERELDVTETREFLRERLSDNMIPSVFVVLDALPRTANGKIDVKALPIPKDLHQALKVNYEAPRNAEEEILCGVWADLLRLEKVGIHHNFFDVGGHSLLATQVISRVEELFSVELSLHALFHIPTVAGLAAAVRKARQSTDYAPLLPVPRTEQMPLSFAQERLWVLDRIENSGAAYTIKSALAFSGPLDHAVLQRCLDVIVGRHEILRTVFYEHEGQPVQVVQPERKLVLELEDLSQLSPEDQQERLRLLALAESERSFDLTQGPLLHVLLVRLDASLHHLYFTMHHIISDAWSFSVIADELSALYPALREGRPSPLPEPVVQYADYAHWQRSRWSGEMSRLAAYWSEKLEGMTALLELPSDRPRPAIQSYKGARRSFRFESEAAARLAPITNHHGATLFMALQTVFAVLMARYSGQRDIAIGTSVAGRQRLEIEALIGFFVNTLVLRNDLKDSPSFVSLLQAVRTTVLEAFEHQDIPLAQVVETVQPERSTSHTPLFQVMFVLQNTPRAALELDDLEVSHLEVPYHTSRFDLTLVLWQEENGFGGYLEYSTDLFDEGTVMRMLAHYRNLLDAVCEQPQTPVFQLPLLGADELKQQLDLWNDTPVVYPSPSVFHQIFESQVARNPEAPALVSAEQGSLSFGQLNERANRWAHFLTARGVGPESIIGICGSRSAALVTGLLGIMKAGGAYLPLEPDYPDERLRFMIEDASAQLVLTEERLMPRFAWSSTEVVALDDDSVVAASGTNNPSPQMSSFNAAYMIYTSGSTGQPKGTLLSHHALVNYVQWARKHFLSEGEAGSPMHGSIGFDATITSLWVPLAAGRAVSLIAEEDEVTALAEALQKTRFGLLKITPAHLDLLRELLPSSFAGIGADAVVVGGEALARSSIADWLERAPESRFFNEYGPTEATVGCVVEPLAQLPAGPVPIGRPIGNVRVYVLDPWLQPVPVGVPGELFISGDGLARGYHRRAGLSAWRFVPNPFAREVYAGDRMYRTGDRVRYLPNGTLVYLGRQDDQVKLRGFRIELGEIERCLGDCPGVAGAAVLLEPGKSALDNSLTAYITADTSVFDGHEMQRLENGIFVAGLNDYETRHLYHDIFQERNYFKHGIELSPGATVFDVGANIGMFSMFVARECPEARVYAFEPMPSVFEKLRVNLAANGPAHRLFQIGLASFERTETFTYYPKHTMMSAISSYTNAEYETDLVTNYVLNEQVVDGNEGEVLARHTGELLEGHFEGEAHTCQLSTVSAVMAAQGVHHIDLLKVDVQGSELEVLLGIDSRDWAKIDQVVMEVHDGGQPGTEGQLSRIRALLASHGFEIKVEQDQLLSSTNLFNLYAVKPVASRGERPAFAVSDDFVPAGRPFDEAVLREHALRLLPEYMVPQRFVLLDELPLTAHGKVDRARLIARETERVEPAADITFDPTQEALAAIWRELLEVDRVGLDENFFRLGGHSISAILMISKLKKSFGVDYPLKQIFSVPDLRTLAAQLDAMRSDTLEEKVPSIPIVNRNEHPPLSYPQQRLWFLDRMEPHNSAYNIPVHLQLEGPVAVSVLDDCLTGLCERHESLRTTFNEVHGVAHQVIASRSECRLVVIDLSGLPPRELAEQVSFLTAAEALTPFDLEQGPLLRTHLIRVNPLDHMLVAVMHHIISDGWSMEIFTREFTELYSASIAGLPSPLSPLPIQYADFAAWQRSWLSGEVLARQQEYWAGQLEGVSGYLDLPTDFPRKETQSFDGAKYVFTLPSHLTDPLRRLCREQDATLFMTLLAVYKVLLFRYMGQSDLTVGTPVANRNKAETQDLIGFFINALVLRAELDPDESFLAFLDRVRRIALDAYDHQDMPYEFLVDQLKLERSLNRSPLIQTMFFVQEQSGNGSLKLPGLTARKWNTQKNKTPFEINFGITDEGDHFSGGIQYHLDLFREERIAGLARQFTVLLEAVLADPNQSIAQFPVLSKDDRRRMLVDWNATERAWGRPNSLPALFEAQALRTPDQAALVFDDEPEAASMNFYQLNEAANRLAHHLSKLGIERDQPVGLCLERCPEMVIAILAILKVGAAYVPLDPAYPEERIGYILTETRASALITVQDLASHFQSFDGSVVAADAVLAGEAPTEAFPEREVFPGQAAYVIYTSGSTGRPKGVLIPHDGIVNRVLWMEHAFPLGGDDKVLQKTAISFDAAGWEIFAPLFAGAQLVLAKPNGQRDPAYLVDCIMRHGITRLQVVPTLLRVLIEQEHFARCVSLRHVFSGGEALAGDLAARFALCADACLVNTYGPTEASIDAAFWVVPRSWDQPSVPIGHAIGNDHLFIVDNRLQPVPPGVTGQLLIGGVGLARGYCHRPALTAERFIPSPFCGEDGPSQAGARLYKTGDLARFLPGHSTSPQAIEFLGRNDAQVKLRGFRIEPGEIESALKEVPGILDALVRIQTRDGKSQLVAYCLVGEAEPSTLASAPTFLKGRLPDYMVPALFVPLASWPVLPSGKIDLRALADLDPSDAGRSCVPSAPRNDVERALSVIWREVLGLDQIGIHDNFFAVGGDSILNIQVVARARQQGLMITPMLLFEHQTIAALAAQVMPAQTPRREDRLLSGALPLTPAQHAFFRQNQPDPHHFNQAVMLEVPASIDAAHLEKALEHLLHHHDALRLRVTLGDSVTQVYGPMPEKIPFEEQDLSAQGLEGITAAAQVHQRGLNFQEGRLVKMVLFRLGGQTPSRLLFIVHHLCIDGVSWRILLEDLQTAYEHLSQGKAVSLPAKTSSLKTWTEHLSDWAGSGEALGELEFWTQSTACDNAALPLDFQVSDPGAVNLRGSTAHMTRLLETGQTENLLRGSKDLLQTRIDDLLLAALYQSLAEWSGHSEFLVDLEGHGRVDLFDEVDTTRTVGWFTTQFPVRLSASDWPAAAVRRVKQSVRAIPRQGIGFDVLRYLDPQNSQRIEALPKAQVLFNYLGQFDTVNRDGDLFRPASESLGDPLSPAGRRLHLLEVTCMIKGGRLSFDLAYSENLHGEAGMARLADGFMAYLNALIDFALTQPTHLLTPSDFPLALLDEPTLNTLLVKHQDTKDIYPVTPMQEGLLLHCLLNPRAGLYFGYTHCRMGSLDFDAFEKAWQAVVARHDLLRTSFYWEGLERPLQVVSANPVLHWERLDLRHLDNPQQDAVLAELPDKKRAAGFSFDRGPLMNFTLVQLAEDRFFFMWCYHHLIIDGWSGANVLSEVLRFYRAFETGRELDLTPATSFRNYVAWLDAQDAEDAHGFWSRSLGGLADITPLPGERSLADRDSHESQFIELEQHFSGDQTAKLLRSGRERLLTPATLAQAAWALVLGYFSGRGDVCFGITLAGRPADLDLADTMVGLFIKTVPGRFVFAGDTEPLVWLKQVQLDQVARETHAHYPLRDIQQCSGIPPGQALFNSIMVFDNYPVDEALEGQNHALPIDQVFTFQQNHYALTATVVEKAELCFKLSYATDQIDARAVPGMLDLWMTLFEALACGGQQTLAALPFVDAAQQRTMLERWNQTGRGFTELHTHRLFETQAATVPEATALVQHTEDGSEEVLTYAQLNASVNRLAHLLREHGVGPESVVGICLSRSPQLVIALLAVQKAGGAYLPLDPTYPPERLAFMMQDSGTTLLLTEERLVDSLPAFALNFLETLIHEDLEEELAKQPDDNPVTSSLPENAAYIIYTSGSTGQPKGVTVTHRGLANYLQWCIDAYGAERGRGASLHAPVGFDATITGLWSPLLVGRQVVILPEFRELEALAEQLVAMPPLSLVKITPAHLDMLAQVMSEEIRPITVKGLVIGGEALSYDSLAFWRDRAPQTRLFNEYGPTESVVGCVVFEVGDADPSRGAVPIGRPIANTRLYVLDGHMNPVLPFVTAELLIGGDGLARGYHQRPAVTATRFIPDPFSTLPGQRLYRSGDQVRYVPDGELEFLGRSDGQIKLRGYRIEPGEIEALLAADSDVSRALVVLREDQPGQAQLVAYLETEHEKGSDVWKALLGDRLPAFMVPQFFVELPALPMTPNGKLDRASLPAPDFGPEADAYVAPRNETERKLAQIWEEVLKVERVGIADNFFDLGGHSLIATQIMSRIHKSLAVMLPLHFILEQPTVAGLAALVEAALQADTPQDSEVEDLDSEVFRL